MILDKKEYRRVKHHQKYLKKDGYDYTIPTTLVGHSSYHSLNRIKCDTSLRIKDHNKRHKKSLIISTNSFMDVGRPKIPNIILYEEIYFNPKSNTIEYSGSYFYSDDTKNTIYLRF